MERLDTQKGITVEALLDSGATGLVMSSEFAKKQGFKIKKLERPMQVRNVDGSFNKEEPIENTVEVNILSGALSGAVHAGVEVRKMYLEMSRLVERPWLQLMCCTVCLPRGHNFR